MDMFSASEDTLAMRAGGTSANLAVAASKCGLQTALLGKVGKDVIGDRLLKEISAFGVNLDGVSRDPAYFTTMSFVVLSPEGERSFSFERQHGADIYYFPEDVNWKAIDQAKAFAYSGMMLTRDPGRSTLMEMLKKIHGKGIYVMTDVSYRYNLWASEEETRRVSLEALKYTDLYKSSDDEAYLLSGKDNLVDAARFFIELGCSLCIISCGGDGSFYYMKDGRHGKVSSFKVDVVDTTGAGDAFFGGFLSRFLKKDWKNISEEELQDCLRFGNAVGGLTATKKGGINGIPDEADVEKLIGA